MDGTLTFEGQASPATRQAIEQHVAAGEFIWLDLDGVDDDARDLLLTVFKVHPLAVEDAQNFGQRPKLEDYDDFMYMVVHRRVGRPVLDAKRSTSSSPTTS